LNFEYEEKADYRFRGIDGGGKDICEIIDWLPKEGMNNFFKEYLDPLSSYKRRYDNLSEEDRREVAPYVRRELIIYRWTDGKFVRNE
jgi:hypothetical protein